MSFSLKTDGFLEKGLVLYGQPPKYVAKGFLLDVPSFDHVSDELHELLQSIEMGMLHELDCNTRIQIKWRVDADYKTELMAYDERTQRLPSTPWAKRAREQAFARPWAMMEQGLLRREKCFLFVSKQISESSPIGLAEAMIEKFWATQLTEFNSQFNEFGISLKELFARIGGTVTPLNQSATINLFAALLNSSYAKRFAFDALPQFDARQSIQENFLHSGVNNGLPHRPPFGFFFDEHYHNCLSLKRLPNETEPGMHRALTRLPFLDYDITVNIFPKEAQKVIAKENKELTRIRNDYARTLDADHKTAMTMKEERVMSLASGNIRPYEMDFIVTVWATDLPTLQVRTSAIKTAIQTGHRWMGAQPFEPTLFFTNLQLWENTWPGNLWTGYTCHAQYAETGYLSDLLPISSTFTGHLKDAEMLVIGDNRNLIGLRTNIDGVPQHCVTIGMTGAGKGVVMNDLLSQTAPHVGYTFILDKDLGYATWTKLMGEKPFILREDGEETINYFDTRSLPLTKFQLDAATRFAHMLCGTTKDEDKQARRLAQLNHYIELVYTNRVKERFRRDPSFKLTVAKRALAVRRYQKEVMPSDTTFLEAWVDFRDLFAVENPLATSLHHAVTNEEALAFSNSPLGHRVVRDSALAYFSREEYPTHPMFWEAMVIHPSPDHDAQQVKDLITVLEPWKYMKLISGPSTVRLDGRVGHFEIGSIGNDNAQLLQVAGYLVANQGLAHMRSLSRAVQKQALLEELASIVADIPGATEWIKTIFIQGRKFNIQINPVMQQEAQARQSPIRSAVMSNLMMAILLKQDDPEDLANLQAQLRLPDITIETIAGYERADEMEGPDKYGSFTYFHKRGNRPLIGSVRHYVSAEMLYISASNGKQYEDRNKALRLYDDILQGVIAEAAKINPSPALL